MSKIWPEENKKLCSMCDEVKHVSEFHTEISLKEKLGDISNDNFFR